MRAPGRVLIAPREVPSSWRGPGVGAEAGRLFGEVPGAGAAPLGENERSDDPWSRESGGTAAAARVRRAVRAALSRCSLRLLLGSVALALLLHQPLDHLLTSLVRLSGGARRPALVDAARRRRTLCAAPLSQDAVQDVLAPLLLGGGRAPTTATAVARDRARPTVRI